MATKKKSKNKKRSNAQSSAKLWFHAEVLQRGATQVALEKNVNTFFRKKLTLGSSPQANFFVPLAALPAEIPLFRVGGGEVYVIIDPRVKGFLNTGTEFGDVRDFITPSGSLAGLSTIDHPLELKISAGGRGQITVQGFEVIFRVEKRMNLKPPPRPKPIPKKLFQAPPSDVSLETNSIWIALLACLLVGGPLFLWLMKAPVKKYESLADLPEQSLIELIHPSHFPTLPYVFRGNLTAENTLQRTLFWISELQKRWNAADRGEIYQSEIALLKDYPVGDIDPTTLSQWESKADLTWRSVEDKRLSPYAPRWFQYQREYPKIQTMVSGRASGSLNLVQTRHLQRLKEIHASLADIVRYEHEFLKTYYAAQGVKKGEIFEPPSTGIIIGSQPDPDYLTERTAYILAQDFADRASATTTRKKLAGTWEHSAPKNQQKNQNYRPIFVSKTSFIHAAQELSGQENSLENMLSNVRYATGLAAIPPPPPPKASIDKKEVALLLLGKRGELQSCYEAALRRKPALAGTVKWNFRIGSSGRIESIKMADATIKDMDFLFCLSSRIASWRFPRPQNGAITLTYPFRFSTQNQE